MPQQRRSGAALPRTDEAAPSSPSTDGEHERKNLVRALRQHVPAIFAASGQLVPDAEVVPGG